MKSYNNNLSIVQTQEAIKLIKDTFQNKLSKSLNILRVSAPLMVETSSGLNDDLSGVEKAIEFLIDSCNVKCQIVHSLAKWKRMALHRYGFKNNSGLYTDMQAIRKCEVLDATHSIYVDQWDWEKIISKRQRNISYLEFIVGKICQAFIFTQNKLLKKYPALKPVIKVDKPFFISAQQLEDMYPNLDAESRENAICKKHNLVFITKIGHKLKKSKIPHSLRSPDYDDWNSNGDLVVWYDGLNKAVELSSMGIRVDSESLVSQLKLAKQESRMKFEYHQMVLKNQLPLTIGGGIGQSRMCLVLLNKKHIGEVQSSVWTDKIIKQCEKDKIFIL